MNEPYLYGLKPQTPATRRHRARQAVGGVAGPATPSRPSEMSDAWGPLTNTDDRSRAERSVAVCTGVASGLALIEVDSHGEKFGAQQSHDRAVVRG